MSDLVQYKMELTIEEISFYKHQCIFTESELKQIIDQRTSYEYKLQRTDKLLLDFLHYINYEQKLEKIVKQRMQIQGKPFITRRIFKLYKYALIKFHDIKLIKSFIKYALKRNEFDFTKEILKMLIKKNLADVDMLLLAVNVCIKFMDFEEARKFLLKGIKVNNNLRIYTELFNFEIIFMKRCRGINKEAGVENEEGVDKGELICIIFKEILEKFGDCEETRALVMKLDDEIDVKERLEEIMNEIKIL